MATNARATSGSFDLAATRTSTRLPLALCLLSLLAGTAFATPVLITAPKTINPLDATITPTAGGSPVALQDAEIVVRGTTLTVNGRHTILSLALENAATLTHSNTTTFDYPGIGIIKGVSLIVAGSVSIDASSSISVSGAGFPSLTGPGAGSLGGQGCGGSGAGHGGAGGLGNCPSRPGGVAYGSATQPTEFGSGGGYFPGFGFGGSGGGCVRLSVGTTLLVDGAILADGLLAINAGGGSGGSIWLSATAIAGSGTVRARGGDQGTSNQSGGGGAGGRIAISACDISPSLTFNVAGGSGGGVPSHAGSPGTISASTQSPPLIQTPPSSVASCPTGVAMFSVTAIGAAPIAYRWQIESAPKGSDVWTDLSDGPVTFDSTTVGTGAGATTSSFSFQNNPANRASFRLRCSLTNICGTVLTSPATYAVCTSDFTCDGGVDDADFSVFVLGYNILDCADPAMPANCPADLNADGFVDDSDFTGFVVAYNLLLCQ